MAYFRWDVLAGIPQEIAGDSPLLSVVLRARCPHRYKSMNTHGRPRPWVFLFRE